MGKINWKADGAPDELFLFNVTDLSSEPPESAAIASITNLDFSQSAFETIAMWDSNNSITDEIRFGLTFGDVMGVPFDPKLPTPGWASRLPSYPVPPCLPAAAGLHGRVNP